MTRLLPTAPPGRITRKARGFAAEIAELRRKGYTLEAIRQALAEAGVQVSTCTVWREARRADALVAAAHHPLGSPSKNSSDNLRALVSSAARPQSRSPSPEETIPSVLAPCSGKKFADVFMSNQVTNPFFRSKE